MEQAPVLFACNHATDVGDGDFVDVILQYDESITMIRKGFGSGRDLVEKRSMHLPGWAEDNHKNC